MYVGGSDRPPAGDGDDVDVAAVVCVLARPAQIDAGVGSGMPTRPVDTSRYARPVAGSLVAGIPGGLETALVSRGS